jgi:hypothetical protein
MKEPKDINYDEFGSNEQLRSKTPLNGRSRNKPKKPSLRERLQQHMAAIAYAEAGEFQSAEEIVQPAPKSRTVLLVIEGENPDPTAFSYAVNLCKRTSAELDILQVIQISAKGEDYELLSQKMANSSRRLVDLVRQLEQTAVPFKVTMRLGEPASKLVNYAKRHKEVAMVVLDSPKAREASAKNGAWARWIRDLSRQLSIPLIAVLDKQVSRLTPEGIEA